MYTRKERRIRFIRNFILIVTLLVELGAVISRITGVFTAKKMWFDIFQCACMIIVMALPYILKKEFKIKVPTELYVLVITFAFSALILGDVLNFYAKYKWWDSMLHYLSGMIIPYFGLWLIKVLMAEKSDYIYMNRLFTAIFVVALTMGLGAIWEIGEYTYDDLFGTNTQQFMASTTGSLVDQKDIPLTGHEALFDTMKDLKLALAGSITIVTYAQLKDKTKQDRVEEVNRMLETDLIN